MYAGSIVASRKIELYNSHKRMMGTCVVARRHAHLPSRWRDSSPDSPRPSALPPASRPPLCCPKRRHQAWFYLLGSLPKLRGTRLMSRIIPLNQNLSQCSSHFSLLNISFTARRVLNSVDNVLMTKSARTSSCKLI